MTSADEIDELLDELKAIWPHISPLQTALENMRRSHDLLTLRVEENDRRLAAVEQRLGIIEQMIGIGEKQVTIIEMLVALAATVEALRADTTTALAEMKKPAC